MLPSGETEIESDFAIVYLDVFCMEITLVQTVFINFVPWLHIGFHLQILVDDERTAFLDESGVVTETIQISLFGSINVQMVWVCGCDDTHPRLEPMERTVELIGFDNHRNRCCRSICSGPSS